jgi:ADP-heptose:LPS heptosyltransferase
MPAFILRVPDHLGDGVMAIPAVRAISALGTVQFVGPQWASRLYGAPSTDHTHPETAVLFKPSFSAAWSHRHTTRRVGTAGDWRRWLLTDVVPRPEGHRSKTYAALATRVGASSDLAAETPSLIPTSAEREAAPKLSADTILLLPLSKSQSTVGWPHYRALADALDGRAVFAAGPGECAALAAIAGPHRCLPSLPVGQFAAVSATVAAVVGNDSGLAHLAQAARRGAERPPASVHVIFGSTSPTQTGPSGCTAHQRTALPCQPCYKKYCARDAAHPPCLDVPVSVLLDALR